MKTLLFLGLFLISSSLVFAAPPTKLNELNNLFEKGAIAEFDQIEGWWIGKSFLPQQPNEAVSKLFWAERKGLSSGPLFPEDGRFFTLLCAEAQYCESPMEVSDRIEAKIQSLWNTVDTKRSPEGHLVSYRAEKGVCDRRQEVRVFDRFLLTRMTDCSNPPKTLSVSYFYLRVK